MLQVVLFVGLVVLGLSFNVELNNEFELYKTTYSKKYTPEEELVRRFIWEENLKRVQQHNLEADRGVHTYRLGMNEYADMTSEEFVRTMNGYKYEASKTNCGKFTFPTVGSLEGQHFNKTQTLVSLSEQNLVDCSGKEGNMGCEGGLMDQAFKYIIKNEGIDTEASYPYKAKNQKCKFTKANVGSTETSCKDIDSGSEADLQKAVSTVGPISFAIDASHNSFQLYKVGIYSDPQCDPQALDHGVLAVGYGTQGGKDYWLVKNSWGTSWGMQGYIIMAKNDHNMCGIATKSSFPTV